MDPSQALAALPRMVGKSGGRLVKFTRSSYPAYTGIPGSPCWKLQGHWVDIDADFNTSFPFGLSVSVHVGRQPPPVLHKPECARDCHCELPAFTPGFLLDLNAPLGEPNRLYLWSRHSAITFGLPSVRDFRETGRETRTVSGRPVTQIHGKHFNNWRHPHIDGIDRYHYHRDSEGNWVRNPEPEPLHWGWLTIERRRA
jgi:hypothetical protein